jgi:hypothetical protein
MSDAMEAEGYVDIEFKVFKGHGTHITEKVSHEINSGL